MSWHAPYTQPLKGSKTEDVKAKSEIRNQKSEASGAHLEFGHSTTLRFGFAINAKRSSPQLNTAGRLDPNHKL